MLKKMIFRLLARIDSWLMYQRDLYETIHNEKTLMRAIKIAQHKANANGSRAYVLKDYKGKPVAILAKETHLLKKLKIMNNNVDIVDILKNALYIAEPKVYNKLTAHDINKMIRDSQVCNTGLISNGKYTFNEMYTFRDILFIAFCRQYIRSHSKTFCWRTRKRTNGTEYSNIFILGIRLEDKNIAFHLPNIYWQNCKFAKTIEKAPEFINPLPDTLETILLNETVSD